MGSSEDKDQDYSLFVPGQQEGKKLNRYTKAIGGGGSGRRQALPLPVWLNPPVPRLELTLKVCLYWSLDKGLG